MEQLLDLTYIITTYGYIGIFAIVFLESGIFFALPGDSLLFAAGILASAGIISIYTLIPLIFIATLLGSIVGYWIGYHLKKLEKYYFFKKVIRPEHLDRAHAFFDKYGRLTMSVSRFVPIVRTFVPIVAGMARMHYDEFIKWNIVGSLLWTLIVTMLGYFLGQIVPEIKDYIHYFIVGVVLISLVPIVWGWRKKKIETRHHTK